MNSITIKKACQDDAPAILALQKAAYQSEAEIYDDDQLPPLTQTLEEMKQDLSSMVVLKAVQDKTLVGSVRARMEKGRCAIGRLIVAPDFQGRGIGTRLMEAVETAFPSETKFELFTGNKSLKNIKLYQRLGYVITRTHELSSKVSLVFMEKNQNPL